MTDNGEHLIDFTAYVKDMSAPGTFKDVVSDPHCVIKKADVVILTCLDFRFFVEISRIMKGIKYDHLILAGAALGATWHEVPKWHDTFFQHVGLALRLHQVERLIVMEHRECGAYGPRVCGGFGLLESNPDRERERQVHLDQAVILQEQMRTRFPTIFVDYFILEKPTASDALTFDKLI